MILNLQTQELYRQLNELSFVEQLDVRSTPDAAPKKEGLLASAYRFMTAPVMLPPAIGEGSLAPTSWYVSII